MANKRDVDEFSDPENPRKISYPEIEAVAKNIAPYILRTNSVPSHCYQQLGMNLYYKMDSCQQSGSFKQRGIVNVMQKLPPAKKKLGIVLASLGNAGDAAAVSSAKLNVPVIVVCPVCVPICRLQKTFSLGAKVIVQGADLTEAQKYARTLAKDKGLTYVNSRDHPDILTGYGTIAIEILDDTPNIDAVLVPVGTGGLLSAVATVIKQRKPSCLVYGIQPEATQCFFKNLQKQPDQELEVDNQPTIAENLNVTMVGANAFYNAKPLIDNMLLVKEEWIARAMAHMFDRERLVVEGAGACGLAAIFGSLVPELKTKNVVAIISGGNVDVTIYSRTLQRGLSAEGQLVQVRIGIKDETTAQTQLLRLIEKAGYNLVHQFQTHTWSEGTEYFLEMCLCCRCRDLLHALELKRILERAYPCTVTFETKPFTDKRSCPCYAHRDCTH